MTPDGCRPSNIPLRLDDQNIMKRLLCIWLPGWPIQRLLSRELTPVASPGAAELDAVSAGVLSELATNSAPTANPNDSVPHDSLPRRVPDRPIVLWDTDPRRGRLVVACCRRAAAQGVRARMPIAGAAEMTKRGQASFLMQHDRWLDQVSLERVATDLQRNVSPLVGIETLGDSIWAGQSLHQPQALLCDITGIAHLFDGEKGLLQATQERLAKFGCLGRMAIADNVSSAWAFAHYATQSRNRSGSESTETFIAPLGASAEYLARLPVESLRLSPPTVLTLKRLGVEQVSQLLALPRSGLASRLGDALVRRIGQALGEVDEPLQVHRAEPEDTQTLELEYPSGDEKILADRVERLIKKVRTGLATRKRGALRISCRLALTDLPPLTFEVGLFAPTLDVDHLTRLLVSAIENRSLPAPVTRITLEVTLSGPLRSSQTPLFSKELLRGTGLPGAESFRSNFPSRDSDRHDADRRDDDWIRNPASARLIDALSGRLGREVVVGVSINENPLPEKTSTLFPLTGNLVLQKQRKQKRRQKASSRRTQPRYGIVKTEPTALAAGTEAADVAHVRPAAIAVGSHDVRVSPAHSRSADPLIREGATQFPQNDSLMPKRSDPIRRPLALLPSPLPLNACSLPNLPGQSVLSRVSGASSEATRSQGDALLPEAFRRGGKIHRVIRYWGPERIETDWWQGDSVRRDYYRIETDQGHWWWIFRCLSKKPNQWMLHGLFLTETNREKSSPSNSQS